MAAGRCVLSVLSGFVTGTLRRGGTGKALWASLMLLLAVLPATSSGGQYVLFPEQHLPGGYVYEDGTIGETTEYSPSLSVNAGRVVAGWYLVAHVAPVLWAWSEDQGLSWARGNPIRPYSDSYLISGPPAVAVGPDSQLHVCFWHGKYGYGGSLEMATFADSANSLQFVRRSPSSPPPPGQPEFIGTLLPRLVADPVTGRLFESYTLTKDSTVDPGSHDLLIAFQARHDSTWTPPVTLSGRRCHGSRLALGPDQDIVLVWKDMANMNRNMIRGCRSTDGGRSFSAPFTIGDAFDHYQVGSGYLGGPEPGPAPPCSSPFVTNYPSLAVDRSRGPRRGTIYVVWTNSIRGSVPPAVGFHAEQEPNNTPATATPVELGEDVSGSCPATDTHTDIDFFSFEGEAGQTVRVSGTVNGGEFGSYILNLGCYYDKPAWPVGGQARVRTSTTCEPLVYTLPSSGRYYLSLFSSPRYGFSYSLSVRTLVPDGQNPARDIRDVVLSSSSDGGVTWSPPRVVNDDPPYYENLLPEVAVDGLGGVHVSWYDRREDSQCGAGTNVYCRYSPDGGRSFFPSERLSDSTSAMDWAEARYDPVLALGDYMALTAEGMDIYAAWTQTGRKLEYDLNEHNIHFRRFQVKPDIRVTGAEATSRQGVVQLTWDVTLPDFMWKFRVLRGATADGQFTLIGEVEALERGDGGYLFADSTAAGNETVAYRIEGVRADEQPLLPQTLSVQVVPRTETTAWRSVVPNPFSGSVELEINSAGAPVADVRVFDARGALVRTLRQGPILEGVARLSWDGLGDQGRALSGGVYFLELSGAGFKDVRKVVLVRR